jgi:hypothetical protein
MDAFTLFHVAISLIAIASGVLVVLLMLASRRADAWTALFLTTTVATSVTGYFFHVTHVMPSHIVGAISLVLLAVAIFARYRERMVGRWRWVYAVTAVASLYLNVFVLVVQSFLKVPFLHELAPTGGEPPFIVAQVTVMVIFIVAGGFAVRRFHPVAPGATGSELVSSSLLDKPAE